MRREVRGVTRGFAAGLSGKAERGPDRKVRRDSFDIADRRAQVFRPIGDGTKVGALSWIDCLLKTVAEWDDHERKKGGARPLGFAGLRVLETLLGRRGAIQVDFRSGRLDPAIDTIARVARLCRGTVIRALARLKALRVLDWVRRTQRADTAGDAGPQRVQVSNAYFFTPERLPARVVQRLRALIARRRVRRADVSPSAEKPVTAMNPELAAALARVDRMLEAREKDPERESTSQSVSPLRD